MIPLVPSRANKLRDHDLIPCLSRDTSRALRYSPPPSLVIWGSSISGRGDLASFSCRRFRIRIVSCEESPFVGEVWSQMWLPGTMRLHDAIFVQGRYEDMQVLSLDEDLSLVVEWS